MPEAGSAVSVMPKPLGAAGMSYWVVVFVFPESLHAVKKKVARMDSVTRLQRNNGTAVGIFFI